MFNSFICISPNGEIVSEYRKMHLFPLTHEPEVFITGEHPIFLDLEGVKVGFATCYDLRFPELFRSYAEGGTEIVFISACFPDPRQSDWSILTRARAIENQYFVVGVNAISFEDINGQYLNYFGHSTVIDPNGHVLVKMGIEAGIVEVTLDMKEVYKSREKIN